MVPEKQIEGSGFGSTSSNWNLASNLLVAARFLIRFGGFHFSIKRSRAIWSRRSRCINKTEWKRLGLTQEFWSVWYRYRTQAEWQIYRLDSRLSSRGTRVSSTAAIGPVGSCDSTVTEQGEGGRRSEDVKGELISWTMDECLCFDEREVYWSPVNVWGEAESKESIPPLQYWSAPSIPALVLIFQSISPCQW